MAEVGEDERCAEEEVSSAASCSGTEGDRSSGVESAAAIEAGAREGAAEEDDGGGKMAGPLIPGLPDDLALDCILARVSWLQLTGLSSVSRSWRAVIQSRAVFETRERTGHVEKLVVVLHKVRALKSVCVRLPAAGGAASSRVEEARQRLASSSAGIVSDDEGRDSETFAYGLSLHDPVDDSWLQLPAIASVGCGVPLFSELACFRGRLFVLGGRDHETWHPRREVFMLDLVAGRGVWQRCANMLTPRASFGCGVIGDKLYVAGGHSEASCALANAEVYDPARDAWEPIAGMNGARSCCTVAIHDQKMYVIGGYTLPGGAGGEGERDGLGGDDDMEHGRLPVDSDDEDGEWADSAEVLDAATGQWKQLENVKQFNDYDEQACTVFGGEIYSFSTLGVEKFNLENNMWTEMYKDSWYMGHRKAWCFAYGDGSTPCLVLAVAPVDNEIFAMVCMGDECDRGCTLLKSKDFGKPGPKLAWEKTVCPVNFVCAFPALCAIEV